MDFFFLTMFFLILETSSFLYKTNLGTIFYKMIKYVLYFQQKFFVFFLQSCSSNSATYEINSCESLLRFRKKI